MFKKAERSRVYLKLALAGPSGSGKTWSALRLATALASKVGGRVAVVDTENGSASLYSETFDFDVMEIEPPYTVQKYEHAIQAAEKAGYKVVVVDSISHQWAGEGGILDRKAKLDSAPGGNSYTNWGKLTPEQERFKSLILQSDVHLICTMRAKQDYVLEANEKGKQAPRKVGMAPIQRDGMEYEFTTMFDIDMSHLAKTSKDRTGLFTDMLDQLTEKHAETLYQWLNNAKPAAPKLTVAPEPKEDAPPKPREPELLCMQCGEKLVMAPSGAGYMCSKMTKQDKNHSKVPLSEIGAYRAKYEMERAEDAAI